MPRRILMLILAAGTLVAADLPPQAAAAEMEFIRVADDKHSFALAESGRKFVVWGVNYDHDETGRLLEDYWEAEWPKVEEDFAEIKALGANVVRIHLQVGKFLDAADKPRASSLERLGKLLALAEKNQLYLDLTGLGCYHKQDVPAWYDELDEQARWQAQAVFWEAVAAQCAASPAVFCYDLMNEPVVAGGNRPGKDWLGPGFGGKHFVQYITLDRAGRERPDVARAWIEKLVAAIRKLDKRHLVTVGVVIEETFGLKCSTEDWGKFVDASKPHAAGWVGFYWGKPVAEYREAKTIGEAITGAWLAEFERRAPKQEKQ